MWTPTLLAMLIFVVAALGTIGVLIAVPASACLWREGGRCDRRRTSTFT